MPRLLLLVLLLPVACAQTGPRPGATLPADMQAQLDTAAERYRQGLEQAARGEVASGHESIDAATSTLRSLASSCLARSDCDPAPILATYDRLLERRSAQTEDAAAPEPNGSGRVAFEVAPVGTGTPNILNGRDFAEVIELNDAVKAAMVEWLTWMRPQLLTAWDNYQFMRHQMWPPYERAGLPEALLFGIMAKESGGRVHAISRAGATGPLQFMYQTGLRFGLGRTDGFDTRYDPGLSSAASVAYLQERLAELGGDIELSLAAYNGGEGRLRRLHQAHPDKRFWDPEIYGQLPAETREYVPMVLAAAWLFLHPEDYGLEFWQVDASPGSVLLARDTTLNEIAICIGSSGAREGWFRALRNLNPQLGTNDPLPAGTGFNLPRQLEPVYYSQCAGDGRTELASALVQARPRAREQSSRAAAAGSHTVRRGDTLAGIARRYGCGGTSALARANGISGPNYLIRPGQRIQLVNCRG